MADILVKCGCWWSRILLFVYNDVEEVIIYHYLVFTILCCIFTGLLHSDQLLQPLGVVLGQANVNGLPFIRVSFKSVSH